LGPEGFMVRSGSRGGALLIAASGNAADKNNLAHGNIGNSYAAYATLEQLGFGFLRPLAPVCLANGTST